ncbi:hypothetical protein MTO96_032097 [Rhipicephalus appendiculatus]
MAAIHHLAATFPQSVDLPRTSYQVSQTALSAARFRPSVATDRKPRRTSSVPANIVPSCGPSSRRNSASTSVLTNVHHASQSTLPASQRLVDNGNVNNRRTGRLKVTSVTQPSLPFHTEPAITETRGRTVRTADALGRAAAFNEVRRTSLRGKWRTIRLSNNRLSVTASSFKRSREETAYSSPVRTSGSSPTSKRLSLTEALICDETNRSRGSSGYYRVPRHSVAVQATTPSSDPAAVADEMRYPLSKQGFSRDGFLYSDEGYRTCAHVIFLSLALLGISALCFWAFYVVGDTAFGARAFGNERRGDEVATVAPQDAVGAAMRKILLDERPLQKTHTAARRPSPPPRKRYFEAAIENNASSDALPPQIFFI